MEFIQFIIFHYVYIMLIFTLINALKFSNILFVSPTRFGPGLAPTTLAPLTLAQNIIVLLFQRSAALTLAPPELYKGYDKIQQSDHK